MMPGSLLRLVKRAAKAERQKGEPPELSSEIATQMVNVVIANMFGSLYHRLALRLRDQREDRTKLLSILAAVMMATIGSSLADPNQCAVEIGSLKSFVNSRNRIILEYGNEKKRHLPIYTYARTTLAETILKHGELFLNNPECIENRDKIEKAVEWIKSEMAVPLDAPLPPRGGEGPKQPRDEPSQK